MEFTSREELFTYIFKSNAWGGRDSASGTGSDISQTRLVISVLPELLRHLGISTLLDVPCGDFHWMASVDLGGINYIGGDIVNAIIHDNKKFKRENIVFQKLDIVDDALPTSDLILCRDCLVHFCIKDIFRTLNNIFKSKSQYLLTTTFTNRAQNYEIQTGQWRPLNLQISPFNFPQPLTTIVEGCTEGDGAFADKTLALWKIDDIKKHIMFHSATPWGDAIKG